MGRDGYENAFAGKVPRLLEDSMVILHPTLKNFQRTLREMSLDDLHGAEVDTDAMSAVSSVQMGRGMVIWVEIDDNSVESATLG